MKKLGVCVVLDNNNFGSMLQSLATQRILSNYGIEYDLIRYKKKKNIKLILRLFNPIMWSDKVLLIKRKISTFLFPKIKDGAKVRIDSFNSFRRRYFHHSEVICNGFEELTQIGNNYDAYMVGSDQLWSPSGLETNFYNLNFVADNRMKFSYAASFGVSQIPENQKKRTAAYLNRIDMISVRENSAANIVEELIGNKVPVVVDPTLLFDADAWDEIFNKNRIIEEPYILVYFLGENMKHRESVRKLKEYTGKKIVLIPMERLHKVNLGLGDIESYEWSPEDFVNLIKYADYVCTDSFHGMVFSTLYHKKFIIFERYSNIAKDSKNTRIDSFCENYGLLNRRYNEITFIDDMESFIDYNEVDILIENKRKESYRFLMNALEELNDRN